MKIICWPREYMKNPDQLGSPLGSPTVQAIRLEVPPCKLFVDSLEK